MSPASTNGIKALEEYAMKSDTRVEGPWGDATRYMGEDIIQNLYPWQAEIKRQCDEKPDDRTINVVHDIEGNIGKSAFCKYMAWNYKAPVIGHAKTGDALNLVSKMPNRSVYLFDMSRSKPADWAKDDISAAMEGVKNGLFMNTKYETSQVLMKCPHIWMFCNSLPNLSSMSRDRWKLWCVRGDMLVRLTPSEISAIRKADKRRAARDLSPAPDHGVGRGRHHRAISIDSD